MSIQVLHIERRGDFPYLARIESGDLFCEPFRREHVSPRYLGWLNDLEVNRYSRRRFVQTSEEDALLFLSSFQSSTNQLMAIRLKTTSVHIGNLQLGPLDLEESHGEVRILIGEKSQWGKGYATQAIYGACSYYFQVLGLHRVEAMSCNPGFIRAVLRLGWKEEGCLRERFPDGNTRLDYRVFGILAAEFQPSATIFTD
jgi:[ribosomal protein S5]-alanine N-acetyltransferase